MEKEILTVEAVARIGLLFLSGDDLERVLLDQTGHTDYDFDRFNRLKRTLLQMERIAPELDCNAILWQCCQGNPLVGAPLVAGGSLPCEGCKRQFLNKELRAALNQGEACRKERTDGRISHYFPVRNSNGEITGALELLTGLTDKIDVSCSDMFVEQKEDAE